MDLQTLSRKSETTNPEADASDATRRVARPGRRWLTRVVLPVTILLMTLALIGYASRDLILPATRVDTARAIAYTGGSVQAPDDTTAAAPTSAGTVVAQAPGWVEPEPFPTYVTTLADGVVREVLVLEGEAVRKGQTLLRLIDDDARLALSRAEAELASRQSDLAAAKANNAEPIALQRAEAVAQAGVAEAAAALTRLEAEITKEQAYLAELSAAYDRLDALGDRSASALQVDAAKYQMQSQQAVVEATQQRKPGLKAQLEAAEATHAAAKRELELKTALRQSLGSAEAAVQAAQVRVDEARLRLERMTIKSPVDGVVMARHVVPGAKLRLTNDEPHSSHAFHLYDPSRLQVRVDVPLADAASVGVGQRATIIVDVLPDVEFTGVVTRLVHRADIAKNTVQFKVSLENPSPLLKPDMLARVKFLGGTGNAEGPTTNAASATTQTAIPRSAVIGGDTPAVWWVSPIDSRIEQKPITLGREIDNGFVIVREGLNPGDVVVDTPAPDLKEGQRVRPRPRKSGPVSE